MVVSRCECSSLMTCSRVLPDAVHPASSPFAPPSNLNTFLNPPSHLDPYCRTPAYSTIGQLANGAFGGLANPAV
ncbi:hypothetical protein chiPu_0028016, partial [Chiloscyllium punctatum]|nr:hypothetical protein [Chiloscyllium punctatum]